MNTIPDGYRMNGAGVLERLPKASELTDNDLFQIEQDSFTELIQMFKDSDVKLTPADLANIRKWYEDVRATVFEEGRREELKHQEWLHKELNP